MDGDIIKEFKKGAILKRKDKTKLAIYTETYNTGPKVDILKVKKVYKLNLSNFLKQLVTNIDLETINLIFNKAVPQIHKLKDE